MPRVFTRRGLLRGLPLSLAVFAAAASAQGSAGGDGQVAGDATAAEAVIRGEYLVRAAGCVSCHTDRDNGGAFLAGGRALKSPFGVFYSPNITPDPRHGIGDWSDKDFINALRYGVAPDGAHYTPAFPYTSYTALNEADIKDIAAYLRAVAPAPAQNHEHETPWWLFAWTAAVWKKLFFTPMPFEPDHARDNSQNRGAYLAAIGHCAECHTPRNLFGALDNDRHLAGSPAETAWETAPNITPDRADGIGKWSENDLAWFLKTGALPDGDYTGGRMAEVIDDGTAHLNEADLRALASYLRAIPPISGGGKTAGEEGADGDEW